MSNVFYIDDLRRYIFSYLRSKPKKSCQDCNTVLVWDKQVKYHIDAKENLYFGYKTASYCTDCYYSRLNHMNDICNMC